LTGFELELAGDDPRDVEHVVDQLGLGPGVAVDAGDHAKSRRGSDADVRK